MPVQATASFTNEDISDKLAADSRFMELIQLKLLMEKKVRTLSLEDKKMLKKYADEANGSMVLKLFTKCGIDYENIFLKEAAISKDLNKDYGLDKRSDKLEIIKSALIKANTEFGDCLAGFSAFLSLCELLYPNGGQELLVCWSVANAAFLACLAALP